jgi:hypothetical protein
MPFLVKGMQLANWQGMQKDSYRAGTRNKDDCTEKENYNVCT